MATKTRTRKAQDAIGLLKEDHAKVKKLLGQLEEASLEDGEATELLQTIEKELLVHTTIEEEIFYPAFKEAAEEDEDTKMFFEAHEEHHLVDLVMPEIKESEAGTPEFAAKCKVLKDLVEHHAEEEEKEMFPRAKKLMDKEQLVSLGEQLAQRKGELAESDEVEGGEEEEDC